MSKVLWHITMSLDGFVAGPDDDMGWLFRCRFDPDPQFVLRTLDQIGAVLIGHRTYHGGDGDQGAKTEKGEPYGGAWHGPQFVFTRDDPGTAAPGFTFVGLDIKLAVQLAKDAAGGKYVARYSARDWRPRCSTRACWTRSWCMSRRSCWATGSGCMTTRVRPISGLSRWGPLRR